MDDSVDTAGAATMETGQEAEDSAEDAWDDVEDESHETAQEMEDSDRHRYRQEYSGNYQTGDTILRGMGMPKTSVEPKRPIALSKALNEAE